MSVDSDDGKYVKFKIGYEDSFALPFVILVEIKCYIQYITHTYGEFTDIETNSSYCILFSMKYH